MIERRPLVVIESPLRGADKSLRATNQLYALHAIKDSIFRGEAPIASHLLYPQVLDDDDPQERLLGIACGLSWLHVADKQVFYVALGWSAGMIRAREVGKTIGIKQEERE